MSTYAPPSNALSGSTIWSDATRKLISRLTLRRASAFGLIMLGALVAFEVFNYGTTEFALRDLMGNLTFGPVNWSVVLAMAFCGMDFAGIARLLSPAKGPRNPTESWYLLGAWAVAAAMNGMLTWWAVSLAVVSHTGLGNEIVGRQELIRSVPIFVSLLVLLIRVLVIGSFALGGTRLFNASDRRTQLMLRPQAARSHRPDVRTSAQSAAAAIRREAGSPAFARSADHRQP
ncbi:MAG: hypothetical protein NTU91_04560 [Chloroflexi bacterium]|jgi:hypothetical protein|nr:hypothetical protein [Chloroflexota bacterium]